MEAQAEDLERRSCQGELLAGAEALEIATLERQLRDLESRAPRRRRPRSKRSGPHRPASWTSVARTPRQRCSGHRMASRSFSASAKTARQSCSSCASSFSQIASRSFSPSARLRPQSQQLPLQGLQSHRPLLLSFPAHQIPRLRLQAHLLPRHYLQTKQIPSALTSTLAFTVTVSRSFSSPASSEFTHASR